MQFWFDAWNADNERAREDYERLKEEHEQLNNPRTCRSGDHIIPGDDTFCRECRNRRERKRRFSSERGPSRTRITPEISDEAVRVYLEEKLSIKATAVFMGLAESTVRDILKRREVETRSLSEARYLVLERRRNQPGGNAA